MKHLLVALFATLLFTGCGDTDCPPTIGTDSSVPMFLGVDSPCQDDSQCRSGICHGVSCNTKVSYFCAGKPCAINMENPCGLAGACIYYGNGLAYCASKDVCLGAK